MHRNRSLRGRQRGVTFLGWVFLLIPMAMVIYAGIRLTPVFLNYTRVARTVSQVADEVSGDGSVNENAIRVAIEKRLDIEGVEYPTMKDFVVRRSGQVFFIEISYEESVPYISNVNLLATFKKQAQVGKGAVGD